MPWSEDFKNRRFLFVVNYEGPWERLSAFFYGVRKDGSLRWDIPINPKGWRRLMGILGDWADRRDHDWITDQVLFRREPQRWERRSQ